MAIFFMLCLHRSCTEDDRQAFKYTFFNQQFQNHHDPNHTSTNLDLNNTSAEEDDDSYSYSRCR